MNKKQYIIKNIETKVAQAWEPVRAEFMSYVNSRNTKELETLLKDVTVSKDGKDIIFFS